MTTPEELERRYTLLTAAARHNELATRDALAPLTEEDSDGDGSAVKLDRDEALELLALGELIARRAVYGRQLAARAAGATWTQIGAALGTTKQSAWEAHLRWLDDQVGWADDAAAG